MFVAKGVKVHDDTHKVLKLLKEQARSRSMDEVIREMIRKATGKSVEQHASRKTDTKITAYLERS